MWTASSASACAIIAAGVLAGAARAEFRPLFNGQDLSGWTQLAGDPEHRGTYHVEDGAIVGTYVDGTANTFLTTERRFGDFVLEFEFLLPPGVNSGVQFRSRFADDRVRGYQFEIDPSSRAWTAGIYHEGGAPGWMYPLGFNPAARTLLRIGAWNSARVECVGPSLRTWLNGAPVAHVIDERLDEGFIGLQVHGLPRGAETAGRTVRWRNIRIDTSVTAPTPPAPNLFVRSTLVNRLDPVEADAGWTLLFDGQDTSHWLGADRSDLPQDCWRVADGAMIVRESRTEARPRRVDLISRETYGAFELQLEFKVTPGGNSGIKYVVTDYGTGARPSYLGLEYQILDDAKHPDAAGGHDGNRTMASLYDLIPSKRQVHDRTVARLIGDWNHAHIVCRPDGSVEHWLNGNKVVRFARGSEAFGELIARSKYRDLDGFGLAPRGHILLQDHGDEVHFRSIKVRTLE